MERLSRTLRAWLLPSMLSILPLSGCMTFPVEGDLPKTPASTTGGDTVHGSLYGVEWSSFTPEKCPEGLGLARVEFHTNALYLLASAVTLGLYVPQHVTWWCDGAPPTEEDEDDDVYVPGN